MKKIILLAVVVVGLAGCQSSELHESMEEMGDSYKTMKKSEDLEAISKEYTSFKAAFDIAVVQQIDPENQPTFEDGMKKAQVLVKDLEAAIAAKELEKAKALLKELGEQRKEYHEKLGVK